jgi:hypothetical protein
MMEITAKRTADGPPVQSKLETLVKTSGVNTMGYAFARLIGPAG